MHSALLQLNLLRLRGTARRALRLLRSPRGSLLGLAALVGGLFLFLPMLTGVDRVRIDPETVRTLAPLGILLIVASILLTSNSAQAVTFTMPEIEFLFAGPFTRRELLLYKLTTSALFAGLNAMVFATVFRNITTWWVAGWLGIWMTLLFIQQLSMAVVLLVQTIGQRAYSLARRLILAALVALVGFGVWQVWPAGGSLSLTELAADFRISTGGRIALAPFEVFGRAVAAETLFPEFLLWGAAALAANIVLATVVLSLDANFLEAALVAGQKRYELQSRVRRGNLPALGQRHTARWRLPELPWLGGAGPVAWRQSIQVVRSSPRALLMLVAMSVFSVPSFVMMRPATMDLTMPIISIVAMGSFFVISTISAGFRADLDYLDWFKMLPLRPKSVVLGELLPPVLFVMALQAVILAGSAALGVVSQHAIVTAVLCFTLPANLLFVTTDNLLFLRYPFRQRAAMPGDMQHMGRQTLMMAGRGLVIFVACGIAAAVVAIFALAGIRSWPVLAAIGWVILMAECLARVWATVSAFRAFDPSIDMPG
jgi:hypothetical protein